MNILDLGIREYKETFDIQRDILFKRIRNKAADTLILVEHFPVVTTGRIKGLESIEDELYFRKKHISVIETNRGGSVTFHSPGQLVLYPIVDISHKNKSIASFLDLLEKIVASALRELGAPAERISKKRGVWIGGKKVAFTGIAFKKWISYHGVSVNINNNISAFSKFHPCGDPEIRVTSLKECTGEDSDMEEVKKLFSRTFSEYWREWGHR
jgi:lipoate-protein ligase B